MKVMVQPLQRVGEEFAFGVITEDVEQIWLTAWMYTVTDSVTVSRHRDIGECDQRFQNAAVLLSRNGMGWEFLDPFVLEVPGPKDSQCHTVRDWATAEVLPKIKATVAL